jgi:tellurite resistance protein TerA
MNSSEGEVVWQVDWETVPSPEAPTSTPEVAAHPAVMAPSSPALLSTAERPPSVASVDAPSAHTMQRLVRGQRINLPDLGVGVYFEIVARLATPPGLVVDIACLGIDKYDRVSDERYFVFYNQEQSPCGGIILDQSGDAPGKTLLMRLARLPPQISRLIVVAAINGAGTINDLGVCAVVLQNAGQDRAEFAFAGQDFAQEKVLMLVELYRKGDVWRLAALGQGFIGGLPALLQKYGVSVV